jgi:Beta-lactamase
LTSRIRKPWLGLVVLVACGTASASPRLLDRGRLFGPAPLDEPVPMAEFTMPEPALPATHHFSGTLRLSDPSAVGGFMVQTDLWDRAGEIGEPIRHLPDFEFRFVQRGDDLVPLEQGVQRRQHPYWEILLQPGKVWDEAGDGHYTRAVVPFALVERAANCIHNGVLSWLFDDGGRVSRVAYEIASETCGYLKFDMWGLAAAEYAPRDLSAEAAPVLERLDAHRRSRLPVRPLADLAQDFPGVEPARLGVADGIRPEDISVLGMVVDGVHYRGDCPTREGPYPFCDELPLPSYSTAKSVFAAAALMRMETLFPGTANTTVASLVAVCNGPQWQDVTLGDVLDMATGNFHKAGLMIDEDSRPSRDFIFADRHAEKIDFACHHYPRKAKPGTRFVYHTSDTYVLGTALSRLLASKQGAGADTYESLLVDAVWKPMHLSALLDDVLRTYDDAAQPFTGWGLTYEPDDILRIAAWLEAGARVHGKAYLDPAILDSALQRKPGDRGLDAGEPGVKYNNGFWAYDAGPSIGCTKPVWVPFMSGVSGITVAMFPNGVTYYYYSDGYVFRWQSAREAAETIRSLCK